MTCLQSTRRAARHANGVAAAERRKVDVMLARVLSGRPFRGGVFAAAALLCVLIWTSAVMGQARPAPAAPSAPAPWPSREEIVRNQQAAEKKPLFATHAPLAFSIAADFRAV